MRYRTRLAERVQCEFDMGGSEGVEDRLVSAGSQRDDERDKDERSRDEQWGSGARTTDFNGCTSVVTELIRSYDGEGIDARVFNDGRIKAPIRLRPHRGKVWRTW